MLVRPQHDGRREVSRFRVEGSENGTVAIEQHRKWDVLRLREFRSFAGDGEQASTGGNEGLIVPENLGQNRRTIGLPAMASERISTMLPSSAGSAQGGAISPAESTGGCGTLRGSRWFGAVPRVCGWGELIVGGVIA